MALVCTLRAMLRLLHINLVQFKNYATRSFDFSERIIGIHGNNGRGKTNLLDAIHYLCFTKSYFSRQDSQNVQYGSSGFRISGEMRLKDETEKAICVLRENGKKEFSVNETAYSKFSQHIGRYPCVVIAPDDSVLVTGDSRERRNFLDALLSQFDAGYLQELISYQKILQQRNAILKSFAAGSQPDFSLLEILDQQLAKPGKIIYNRRKEFLELFIPQVISLYHSISNTGEKISMRYESELHSGTMEELLKAGRSKDLLLQRTSYGVHRDELVFQMDDQLFKLVASQGQRKSLLFALKLAEMEVLQKEKGFAPLLLLDDVFEKLDEDRISNLLHKVCHEQQGQVFITDTHASRLASHLDQLKQDYQTIAL